MVRIGWLRDIQGAGSGVDVQSGKEGQMGGGGDTGSHYSGVARSGVARWRYDGRT